MPVSAQVPDSQLPSPKLFTLLPPGGKAGTSVEVTWTGNDLEEPQALLFSHPSIKAVAVVPPAPPADPKKPAQPMPKPPITTFKVTIAPNSPLGVHDARLVNKWGVSNPRSFIVGDLPEVLEKEPNNDVPEAHRVQLNSTVNGNLASPVDVDFYVVTAKRGQRVVVSCLATGIDSRLQAGLELYDKNGRQLAFNRGYSGSDAVLDHTIAEDGDYYVRVYEFTHTLGSPEHFYRLTISTGPWIDAVFPATVPAGKPAQLTVYGRNLPGGQSDPAVMLGGRALEKAVVTVTVPTDPAGLHRLAYSGQLSTNSVCLDGFELRVKNATGFSNPFLLTYARAPVVLDNGANKTQETAQEVAVPCEIAGRIEKKGDRDWYVFNAKKGDTFNIEVFSDRLGSATDMVFRLHNPAAKADIVEMDDHSEQLNFNFKFYARTDDPGVYTFTAPADGKYQLMAASRTASVHAGPQFFYQVRIAPARPDFHLIALPAADSGPDSGCLLQRSHQNFSVFAWRHDGFNGDITLTAEGLPKGVTAGPQTIGPSVRQINLVLSAAADAPPFTGEIKMKGTAKINGQTVVREARPVSIVWPVSPGQNIPTQTRLDRGLFLAVRPQAPFALAATIDKPMLVQGDKANVTVKLSRLWPDFKTPLQVFPVDLPPNLTLNNNQPITLNPGKDDAAVPVVVNANVLPGTYNLVFKSLAQIPYNKDPKGQKQPINVVLPSTPMTVTVLPKQVAAVSVDNANLTGKVGASVAVIVKVARMYDYAGPFKVTLVPPANVQGVTAAEATIPAGKDETKLVVAVAANAAVGNRPDLVVRAVAMFNGNVPVTQETKIAVNVVK